jgi:hypothetical protein
LISVISGKKINQREKSLPQIARICICVDLRYQREKNKSTEKNLHPQIARICAD